MASKEQIQKWQPTFTAAGITVDLATMSDEQLEGIGRSLPIVPPPMLTSGNVIETTGVPVPVFDPTPLKLDLGCGDTPREGYKGVDLYSDAATYKFDLWDGEKWPIEDNSVDAMHSSHVIEHIELGNRHKTYTGQGNLFYFFFQECFRIAKPGCTFELQWPALQSVRAFQDPTHCRFIPQEGIQYYLQKDWRAMNKLEHYSCKGIPLNWVMTSFAPTISTVDALKADVVQQQEFRQHWNFAQDLVAVLKAVK